jgi:hypothetical protein
MKELDNKITLGGTVSGWPHESNKGFVTLALPFTFKSILRQKKNYGNLNISP